MRVLFLCSVLLVVLPAFGQQPNEITNSIGMKLVLIPRGTFEMGSSEEGSKENQPRQVVSISSDYYMGVHEVTQAQYLNVVGKNPVRSADFDRQTGRIVKDEYNPNHPVGLKFQEVTEFCNRLSELPEEKEAGRIYGLPAEAEWEYA